MKVNLLSAANKYLNKLDTTTQDRIKSGLKRLSSEPPLGDIKTLKGKNGYRLRIGDYRLLFDIIDGTIIVYDIGSRGDIYK